MQTIKSRLQVLLGVVSGLCIAFIAFVDNIEYLTSGLNWLLFVEVVKFFRLEIIVVLCIVFLFGPLRSIVLKSILVYKNLMITKQRAIAFALALSILTLLALLGNGLWEYANVKSEQWRAESTRLLLEAYYDASSGQIQRAKNTLVVCEKLFGDGECTVGLKMLNERDGQVQELKEMRSYLMSLEKNFEASLAIYQLNGDEREILRNCATLNNQIKSLSSAYGRMIDQLKANDLTSCLALCDSINYRFWSFGNCHVLKEELTIALSTAGPRQPLVYLETFRKLDKERIMKIELLKYQYDCDSIFGINEQWRYGIRH